MPKKGTKRDKKFLHWSIKFAMITSTKVSKEWKHSFGAFLRCMYTQWADVQGKEIRK